MNHPTETRWPYASGTTAAQREAAHRLMLACADSARRWERTGEVFAWLAVGLAAVGMGWALVAWVTPCEGASLCMGAACIPTQRPMWQRLWLTLRLRWRMNYHRARIAAAEGDLDHYEREAFYLPLQMKVARDFIGAARVDMAQCEAELRDLWGRPGSGVVK